MALKEGKKTVKLRASVADNIGIPKFPTTNIAAEISKPISEIVDTFRKTAEADAKVEWQYNFNQQSRDHYLQLKEKFKFDPDGMRNAIDSYSKTTLANTPRVYKNIAENLLSQKNLANMSYASTNFEAQQTNNLLTKWEETKSQTITDTSNELDTLILNPNASAMDINSHIGNVVLKNTNHNYGLFEETAVGTNRYKGTQLKKDLENDIVNIEALRVFSLIKKLGDKDGLTLFTNYAMGKDDLPVTPDNVDNPIFQKYSNDIKNPLIRSKIIKQVKSFYADYKGKKIGELQAAKIKYNLDGEQDAGRILDVDFFRDGRGNATDYVIKNMPGISETDFPKAVEIVDKNIRVQNLVSEAINGKIINDWSSNEQMELFQTALFRRYGLNDTNIADVNNRDALGKAMELLKNQNMEPTAVLKKIRGNYNVSFKTPGMVEKFEENLALYNFIKSKDMFPYIPIENENFYLRANEDITGYDSREVKAERLNTIVGDKDFDKNFEKISKHINDNIDTAVANMRWTIEMQDINTDTWWLKKPFIKGDNKFSHMFIPESTSFWYYGTKMTDQVQDVWLTNTKKQLTYLNGGKDIDINTNEGKVLFYKASMQALNSMNKQGYSATRLTGTGEIAMIKHGFEKESGFTGQGFDSALMAQANYLNTLPEEERIERFGFKAITPDGKKIAPVDITEIMKTVIDSGYKNLIIEPTGTMNKYGKPNYHAKIIHEDRIINLTQGDNYFDPTGLGSNKLVSDKLPGSRAEVIQTIADQKFQKFLTSGLGKYIDDQSSAWQGWLRKFLYGTTKTFIEASDYRFYPDFPGVADVPAEVKPFGFALKVLGKKDIDVESYYNEAAKINNEINELVSYDKQITGNSSITEKDKLIESVFPPHKTSYTEQNLQLGFRQHVYNNYQNKSLPLPFRTNNYMAVMKTEEGWDGEMTDISTGNQAAIFASPVDSIRAGMRVMLNNSTLSTTNTTKRYGDTPTIEEILTVYAEKSENYLNALEAKTNFTRDTEINFFDSNQVMQLIKFMIEHEMGSEAFNTYYPSDNQQFLDAMIYQGYTKGINSFGGTLGKLN
jgi:hypothetical protein